MKKSLYILLLALPILFGCQEKEFSFEGSAGSEVKFSANTYYQNGLKTKTEYSGYDENNQLITTTSQYERIDWVDNDLMSIYETDGTNNSKLDYKVVSHEANNQNSLATIAPNVTNNSLVWLSDDTHTFYALYPSPTTEGVDATKVTLDDNVITASIPASQVVTASTSNSHVFKPDMNYAYMWAATTADAGSTVALDFKPLMTAFEITLGTSKAEGLVLDSFSLTTDDSSPYLAGDFTATIGTDLSSYTVSDITNGSRAITVDFDDVSITTTSPVTFTVFALPQTVKNLDLNFFFDDGTSKVLKLKSRASDTDPWEYMTFAAGQKYRINNLNIGDGWVYTLQEVTAGDALIRYSYTAGNNTNTKGIYSYRTKTSDNTVEEVAMKFRYSPADDTGANTEDWSDDLPDWLTALLVNSHTSEQAPDDAFTLTGTYTAIPEQTEITLNELETHSLSLQGKTPAGSESNPKDLTLYDITNLSSPRSAGAKTANSYVVDRPGWFMFPLVYGNAIDFELGSSTNGWNINSYSRENFSDLPSGSTLPYLTNYVDGDIDTPYILDNVGLTSDQVEAVILWEDVAETDAFMTTAQLVSDPVTTAVFYESSNPSVTTVKTVPYIKFYIDPTKAREGNAVIALRESSGSNRIIWSWHIWIFDSALTTTVLDTRSTAVPSNDILSRPLGYCDDKVETHHFWIPRIYYVEATQVDSENNPIGNAAPVVFPVKQYEDDYYITDYTSPLYYQHGRKDAFMAYRFFLMSRVSKASSGYQYYPYTEVPRNKDCFSPINFGVVTGTAGLLAEGPLSGGGSSKGIQKPTTVINSGQTWYGSNVTRNLWNMCETNAIAIEYGDHTYHADRDRKVIKTVYDPCPPGYSVPNYAAFTLITADGSCNQNFSSQWNYVSFNYDDYNSYNMDFWANEAKTRQITIYVTMARKGASSPGQLVASSNGLNEIFYLTAKSKGGQFCCGFTKNKYWTPSGPVAELADGNVFGVLPAKEIP